MNAERLQAVLAIIADDEADFGFVRLLQAVETAYTSSVQAPAEAQALAYEEALKALRAACEESRVRELSPSRRGVLMAIGGQDLLPPGLGAAAAAVADAGPTPADVVTGLQQLRTRVQTFVKAAASAQSALTRLNVADEDVPADQAELELVLPSRLIGGGLGSLSKQLDFLSTALGHVTEAATGKRATLDIRSLGSGSAEFYIVVDPTAGAAIIVLISSLVTLYNSLLQARKSTQELRQQSAPERVLKELQAWEAQRIKETLNKLREDLIKRYPDKKDGRRNELDNGLAISLPGLAERLLNQGLTIDVTPPEPPEPVEGAETPSTSKQKPSEQEKAADVIRQHSGAINLLERGAETPLQITLPPEAGSDESGLTEPAPPPAKRKARAPKEE